MGKATPRELTERFGKPYTASDLSAYLSLLEKENLLEKVQDTPPTYKVSGLGLIAIGALPKEAWRVFKRVSSERCFRFQIDVGPSGFTGVSACNLSDMGEKVKTIDIKALEFHIPRGDIERWVKDVLGDDELTEKIRWIREQSFKGEELRNQFSKAIELRIRELTSTIKSLLK